ncbi:MAG TPA: hypothetical protein VK717_00360 [Opitutaceae bacterium]|jgi:hypothetical protein|nr:hypothetical protein [Opitutaceae bacterium]
MKKIDTLSILAEAQVRIRRGQSLEGQAMIGSLAAAVIAYDEAVALLQALPLEGLLVRHNLGLAWMNLGNALQKQGTAEALARAVCAYDETIALLAALFAQEEPMLCNSLGAAWMNRGSVLQKQNSPASLGEAITSHERAIDLLRRLPLADDIAFRRNLAAAWMNHGSALLQAARPPAQVRISAEEALSLVAGHENEDVDFAEVGLKARIVLCQAMGGLLALAGSGEAKAALMTEASDAVDDGLELLSVWAGRGGSRFRPWQAHLFRFGAHLYRAHQPHFLAEFLLESLDPGASSSAMPVTAELLALAREALSLARAEACHRAIPEVGTVGAERLMQTLRDLRMAEERLSALHPAVGGPAPAGSI